MIRLLIFIAIFSGICHVTILLFDGHISMERLTAAIIVSFILFAPTSLFALTRDIAFPIDGPAAFKDDFHDPRGGGNRLHLGIDIPADKMTPVVAATDGEIVYVVSPEASWGYSLTLEDADGYQYRYLHLNNDTPGSDDGMGGEEHAYATGITRGVSVSRGQLIGWVGDSGNAESTISHLHFEIRSPEKGAIDPYDSLVQAASSSPLITIKDLGRHVADAESTVRKNDVPSFLFTRKLAFGAKGEEVRQLQYRLDELGYMKDTVATGYFGSRTRKALLLFQRAHGLEAVGYVGPKTRALLNGS